MLLLYLGFFSVIQGRKALVLVLFLKAADLRFKTVAADSFSRRDTPTNSRYRYTSMSEIVDNDVTNREVKGRIILSFLLWH